MRRVKGCALLCNQWKAMFLKKILLSYHSKLIVFIQIFLPAIVLVLRLYLFGGAHNPFDIPPMTFGLHQYRTSVTYLEVDDDVSNHSFEAELVQKYRAVVADNQVEDDEQLQHYHVENVETRIDKFLLEKGKTQQPLIDRENLFACTIKKGKLTAWMNNQALHTAPLSLNLLHNAMAK